MILWSCRLIRTPPPPLQPQQFSGLRCLAARLPSVEKSLKRVRLCPSPVGGAACISRSSKSSLHKVRRPHGNLTPAPVLLALVTGGSLHRFHGRERRGSAQGVGRSQDCPEHGSQRRGRRGVH